MNFANHLLNELLDNVCQTQWFRHTGKTPGTGTLPLSTVVIENKMPLVLF